MKKTYCLITHPRSNLTYWVQRLDPSIKHLFGPIIQNAIDKYGPVIYLNRNGGWFNDYKGLKIVETREQSNFPPFTVEECIISKW